MEEVVSFEPLPAERVEYEPPTTEEAKKGAGWVLPLFGYCHS